MAMQTFPAPSSLEIRFVFVIGREPSLFTSNCLQIYAKLTATHLKIALVCFEAQEKRKKN